MYLATVITGRIVPAMNDWNALAKAKMKELKITQEGLAERLGVTQGAVAHWLGGRREPDLATINKILQHRQITAPLGHKARHRAGFFTPTAIFITKGIACYDYIA